MGREKRDSSISRVAISVGRYLCLSFGLKIFILLFLCKCAPLHFLSYLSFNLKYFKSDSASPLSLIIGSEIISCLNLPFSPLNLFIFGNYVFIFISESHFSLFFFFIASCY